MKLQNKAQFFVSFISTIVMVMSTCCTFAFSIAVSPQAPTVGEMTSAVQKILGVAQWIGFIVGVAMIIWVGVKYLTAGAGQKAEVKSTMIPILVGAFLVALAPTIANWLFTMFGSNGGGRGAVT